MLTGYRLNKSLNLRSWESVRPFASGFATRLTLCQIFVIMSVVQTRHILCFRVMWAPKNNIFWGSTNPEHCPQRQLHFLKCTAWVAISKHGIVGPFRFEDDNEHCVTINTDQLVQVLRNFWTALGRWKEVVRVRQWFQQDGAIPCNSKKSLTWLNQHFSNQLISLRCDSQWSPYSFNVY